MLLLSPYYQPQRWAVLGLPTSLTCIALLQIYEGAYLLVEGCCRFTNECCATTPSGSLYSISPGSTSPGLPSDGARGDIHPPHQQDSCSSTEVPLTLTRVVSLTGALPDSATMPPSVGVTSLVAASPTAVPANPVKAAVIRAARTVAAATGMLKPKPAGSSPAHEPASPSASGDLEALRPSSAVNGPIINKSHLLTLPAGHRPLQRHHRIFRSGNVFSLSALNVFGAHHQKPRCLLLYQQLLSAEMCVWHREMWQQEWQRVVHRVEQAEDAGWRLQLLSICCCSQQLSCLQNVG